MERVLTDLLKRLLVFLLWRAGSRAGVDWRRTGRRYHLRPGPQLTRGHMSAHGLRLLQIAASQATLLGWGCLEVLQLVCELWRLTAEEGVDTEEAEDQAQELSEDRRDGEAGEWRDTGQGQDTSWAYFTWKIIWSGMRLGEGIFIWPFPDGTITDLLDLLWYFLWGYILRLHVVCHIWSPLELGKKFHNHRRPLVGPIPGWKCLLLLSNLKHL